MSRVLYVLVLAALSSAPLLAQMGQQAPPSSPAPRVPHSDISLRSDDSDYTLRTTSSLVLLDVVVTDRKGSIVRDLRREDFQVMEDGAPQKITAFEQSGLHLPEPQQSIDSTADLDRVAPQAPVNIVLLDEFNTRFEDMAFARYSLKRFLDTQPGKLVAPTELVAVSLNHFTVLHDYTQNKQALLDALHRHFGEYPWQVHNGGWVAERYARAFETLRSVALATEGHPGHKNMIWIGRGFPSIDLVTIPPDARDEIDEVVESTVNTLRDARITLYTIDPAGLMTNPEKYGGSTDLGDGTPGMAIDPFGGNYEFGKLAVATGGRSLYGRNDVDAEIGTAIRDGSSFYTIAYHPSVRDDEPGRFRPIRVVVDRPGLTAISREGYYPSYTPATPADPKHANDRTYGDLIAADHTSMVYDGVRMNVAPDPDNGAFRIHIDRSSLNWISDPYPHVTFILVVSTFDKNGKELEAKARSLTIGNKDPVPADGRSIDVVYKFVPNPRAVRAHFVVRLGDTGRIGSKDLPLAPPSGPVAGR